MGWSFTPDTPVYLQIRRRLRADILRGRWQAGEAFPTVRALAVEAAVNPNTVQRALTCLEEEGLLLTRGTAGRFVTGDETALTAARDRAAREAMKDLADRAKALGIRREELLTFIQEEEWT